jgi:hypothetical protein
VGGEHASRSSPTPCAFFRKHKLRARAYGSASPATASASGSSRSRASTTRSRGTPFGSAPGELPIDRGGVSTSTCSAARRRRGNTVRRVLLVVAYRELIDRYVAACKKAGIRLSGIDLEAFALLRALGEPPAGDEAAADAALVVVSIGHDRSTFAVSDGSVCEFTRVLDWGGQTLDVAISRELDCAPSEAEPFKRELSLATANVPEGLTRSKQTMRAKRPTPAQAFARDSSPRSSSTRTSPDPWASERS